MLGKVWFPGLGIGPIEMNPVAFSLFGKIDVAWYGILITTGIILAMVYVFWRTKQKGIPHDKILDIALVTIPSAIVGARLYYVLTSLDSYKNFWDIFKIWEGGLAIYGGIIGGGIAVAVMAYVMKLNIFELLDIASPALMIGQILGRWGNFINMEAHGGETMLPWRMGLSYFGDNWTFVHPTFLYESLWNLLGFILINFFYGWKKDKTFKKYDGQIFLMVFTWYGFGRMLIEGLRTDSLYIFEFLFGETIRVSQVLGGAFFVIGAGLLLYHHFSKTDMLFRKIKK